jgi:hypothetical protein
LRSWERAEMASSSVHMNTRPPSLSASRHTLKCAGFVSLNASVCTVLRPSCSAEIAPTIVRWIPVVVVDHLRAPFAGPIEPSEPMCSVLPTVDGDLPVTVDWHRTGNIAGSHLSAPSLAPAKFAGLAIVIQQFAQPRAGHSRTSSHGGLTNKKGLRERPWGRGFLIRSGGAETHSDVHGGRRARVSKDGHKLRARIYASRRSRAGARPPQHDAEFVSRAMIKALLARAEKL